MIIQFKVEPWDKVLEYDAETTSQKIKSYDFRVGDFYVIKTDSHNDLGEIIKLREKEIVESNQSEDKGMVEEVTIIRKAIAEDFEKKKEKEKKKKEILTKAEEIIKKYNLKMKLADIHLSLDGGKIVFAFLAPERVDFRNLVKDLSQEFHRSIRLHQINPREEVKIFSGIGSCGYPVCCLSFLKNLGGIKTNFIEEQQLQHRGVDRLSGLCGRLKCCLAYEKEFYQEQINKMPALGKKIKIKGKNGKVIAWHLLKGSVDLMIDKENTIIEVGTEELKE